MANALISLYLLFYWRRFMDPWSVDYMSTLLQFCNQLLSKSPPIICPNYHFKALKGKYYGFMPKYGISIVNKQPSIKNQNSHNYNPAILYNYEHI